MQSVQSLLSSTLLILLVLGPAICDARYGHTPTSIEVDADSVVPESTLYEEAYPAESEIVMQRSCFRKLCTGGLCQMARDSCSPIPMGEFTQMPRLHETEYDMTPSESLLESAGPLANRFEQTFDPDMEGLRVEGELSHGFGMRAEHDEDMATAKRLAERVAEERTKLLEAPTAIEPTEMAQGEEQGSGHLCLEKQCMGFKGMPVGCAVTRVPCATVLPMAPPHSAESHPVLRTAKLLRRALGRPGSQSIHVVRVTPAVFGTVNKAVKKPSYSSSSRSPQSQPEHAGKKFSASKVHTQKTHEHSTASKTKPKFVKQAKALAGKHPHKVHVKVGKHSVRMTIDPGTKGASKVFKAVEDEMKKGMASMAKGLKSGLKGLDHGLMGPHPHQPHPNQFPPHQLPHPHPVLHPAYHPGMVRPGTASPTIPHGPPQHLSPHPGMMPPHPAATAPTGASPHSPHHTAAHPGMPYTAPHTSGMPPHTAAHPGMPYTAPHTGGMPSHTAAHPGMPYTAPHTGGMPSHTAAHLGGMPPHPDTAAPLGAHGPQTPPVPVPHFQPAHTLQAPQIETAKFDRRVDADEARFKKILKEKAVRKKKMLQDPIWKLGQMNKLSKNWVNDLKQTAQTPTVTKAQPKQPAQTPTVTKAQPKQPAQTPTVTKAQPKQPAQTPTVTKAQPKQPAQTPTVTKAQPKQTAEKRITKGPASLKNQLTKEAKALAGKHGKVHVKVGKNGVRMTINEGSKGASKMFKAVEGAMEKGLGGDGHKLFKSVEDGVKDVAHAFEGHGGHHDSIKDLGHELGKGLKRHLEKPTHPVIGKTKKEQKKRSDPASKFSQVNKGVQGFESDASRNDKQLAAVANEMDHVLTGHSHQVNKAVSEVADGMEEGVKGMAHALSEQSSKQEQKKPSEGAHGFEAEVDKGVESSFKAINHVLTGHSHQVNKAVSEVAKGMEDGVEGMADAISGQAM